MALVFPSKKRWLARRLLVNVTGNQVVDNPPFQHVGRTAAMASIVDAWSVVVALPLFVSVGLQDNVTPPQPLNQAAQQVVQQWWPPDAWPAQRAPWTPQIAPSPPGPWNTPQDFLALQWPPPDWPPQHAPWTPNKASSFDPLTLGYKRQPIELQWPALTWDAQHAPFTPNKAASFDPPPGPYARPWMDVHWPPLDWPAQTTRKTPIPSPDQPPPSPHRALLEVERWSAISSVPLWQTFGAQSSVPVVNNPPPANNNQDLLVGTWPQPDWPTQYTEKTPIPDVPLVPYSRASFQGIDRWEPLTWDTQITRKTPVPSVAPQVDNPPPRTTSYQTLSRWFDRPTIALWQNLGYRNGPTVPPVDNPPPLNFLPQGVYTGWEPPPYQAVWGQRLIDLSQNPVQPRRWFWTVLHAWTPPPFQLERRPVVTPSGVLVINNPPFSSRRPQLPAYDANWPPAAWPAQHAPFLVQPGVDLPPVTDLLRRRSLDIITRAWDTSPEPPPRRTTTIARGVVFRRTLSSFGTGVGHRQPHGWT